jgi:hypothetical protein
VWRAADTALAALAAGHVDARQAVVRREEAFRGEFVDDLLCGRADIGSLVERAEPLGLTLAGAHVVVVAATDRPITSGMTAPGGLEDDVRARLGAAARPGPPGRLGLTGRIEVGLRDLPGGAQQREQQRGAYGRGVGRTPADPTCV